MNLARYKENLKVVDDKVYSYNIHVATIDFLERKVYIHGWWSMATSKHINYVAKELDFKTETKQK